MANDDRTWELVYSTELIIVGIRVEVLQTSGGYGVEKLYA